MDTSNEAIRTGDLAAWADTIEADRREDYTVVSPDAREDDGVVTWMLVGRAGILISPDGTAQVRVHDHPDTSDEECWERIADGMRESIAQANGVAMLLRRDPRAQAMIAAGMPVEMILALARTLDTSEVPDTAAMPVRQLPSVGQPAGVEVPVADAGPLTGFYL